MQRGVFLPTGNKGWLIPITAPRYKPRFALNRAPPARPGSFGGSFARSFATSPVITAGK